MEVSDASPRDPRSGAKRKGSALVDANGGKAQRAGGVDGPKREKVLPCNVRAARPCLCTPGLAVVTVRVADDRALDCAARWRRFSSTRSAARTRAPRKRTGRSCGSGQGRFVAEHL